MIKNIKILGFNYKIIEFDDPTPIDNKAMGRVDNRNGIIYLGNNMSGEFKAETLFHEVLHAFSECMDLELEEKVVYPLATALYLFLKDNDIFSKEFLENFNEPDYTISKT